MSTILENNWKPFIKLTLINAGEGGFDGFAAVDVNQRINLIWNETDKHTTVILGDGKTAMLVKETPDEICTMVDACIEAQKARMKAEHEALMAQYDAVENAKSTETPSEG